MLRQGRMNFVGRRIQEKKELADEDMREKRMMNTHILKKREGTICQFVNE